jgi:hypothetical protein
MFEWQLSFTHPLSSLQTLIDASGTCDSVFHVHGSFGDVYVQISVIKETLDLDANVCVIIDKRYATLINNSIGNKVKIVLADGNQVNNLLSQLKILGKCKGIPTRLLPTLYPMVAECITLGHLQMVDFLRALVESNSVGKLQPIESNSFLKDEAEQLLIKSNLPIGRTALICADNNTEIEIDVQIWKLIIDRITSNGWVPCLNSAGTLTTDKPRLLASLGLPTLNVPAHLPVSVVNAAGTYFVGNNGFATIQSMFNSKSVGFHLIRGDLSSNGSIPAKDGRQSKAASHALAFKNQFLNIQKEFFINDSKCLNQLTLLIDQVLSSQ